MWISSENEKKCCNHGGESEGKSVLFVHREDSQRIHDASKEYLARAAAVALLFLMRKSF